MGFHVPVGTDSGRPEQRILEQSVRLPEGGAVTGWAACRFHRAGFFDGLGRDGVTPKPVPLALGPNGNIRPNDQVTLTYERLEVAEVVTLNGIPCTNAARATFDAMRQADDDREAVVGLDMMAAAERISIMRVATYAAAHGGWQRIGRVLRAVDLASEHSRSPNETRLRLIWVLDAGLSRDVLVNCPVHDRTGALLGIADLLDPVAGLAVEFDGAEHRGAGRHTRDVAKDEAFRRCGLEVTRVTGTDLLDTSLVVERLLAARARAAVVSRSARTWAARPTGELLEDKLREREELARIREELDSQPQFSDEELHRL